MSKFKVGDRVRVVREGNAPGGSYHEAKIGMEFTITGVMDDEYHTDVWYFYEDEIALAYKVGDSVQYEDKLVDGIGIVRAEGNSCDDILVEIEPRHADFAYHDASGNYTSAPGTCRYFDADDLEPVAVAAGNSNLRIEAGRHYKTRDGETVGPMEAENGNFRAYVDGRVRLFAASGEHLFGNRRLDLMEEVPLKIEAGKYYRTRDGRKVGPMRGPEWSNYWKGYALWDETESYRMDGRCLDDGESEDDLIAEWTDEPVAVATGKGCAAAEVDNLRDEYGWAATKEPKFKVGDRVKFRDDYGSDSRGKEATVIKVNVWGDDGIQVDQGGKGGVSTEAAHDLRLVAPATSGKFKVGDRVRNPDVPEAGVGVVEAIKPDGVYQVNYRDTWFGICHDTDYTLVLATSPAIVARLDNGQPRPAVRPFVHTDRDAAAQEAARLAAANPGKEFAVYEFVSAAKEEKRYEHEWQRAAKDGREYEAACLLQDMAGTSFGGAQKAVEHWLTVAA